MLTIATMHDSDGHMMQGWMSAWMALWAVLAVALIVLAVVAAVWLVRHLSSGRSHQHVLERQYAAGEISREEFLLRRDDLARR